MPPKMGHKHRHQAILCIAPRVRTFYLHHGCCWGPCTFPCVSPCSVRCVLTVPRQSTILCRPELAATKSLTTSLLFLSALSLWMVAFSRRVRALFLNTI